MISSFNLIMWKMKINILFVKFCKLYAGFGNHLFSITFKMFTFMSIMQTLLNILTEELSMASNRLLLCEKYHIKFCKLKNNFN